MNFEQFLETYAPLIDKKVERILDSFSSKFGKLNPLLKARFDEFKKAARGGKRIRGALVLLGFKVAGGKSLRSALDIAAAFEIFQTAILAQDDIIDKSLIRRGKPSLYSALGGDHRAISETICLSDLGFFICFKLLSGKNPKIVELFSESLIATVLGEILDTDLPGAKFTERDVIKIGLLKTADYSFATPLKIGAMLGGGNRGLIKKLGLFGTRLGVAYQIQDDILGVFSDEKTIGKSVSSDIQEGKATLLIATALKKSNKNDLQKLKQLYGKEMVSAQEEQELKQIFIDTGALDYAQSQVELYLVTAQRALKGLDEHLLYSLVDFLKSRKK